jgi:glycosyltransferase involved in cell wall biosynthesis
MLLSEISPAALGAVTASAAGGGAVKVLVVTKMWPTPGDALRNGFLKHQVQALRDLGVDCDVLVTQDRGSGPLGYLRAALAVRRALALGEYDIVHAHYGLTGLSCLAQSLPLVLTLHGSDIYGAVDADGRTTLKGRMESAISRLVARRADVVIAVSSRMLGLIERADAVVVPVGIDTNLFRPIDQAAARRELGLDRSTPYVLFAANPENPVKRHWLAQQALSILQAEFPTAELVSVFGEPLERMPLWMNAADVLLITSAYEGGPMIHREAMACNLPVVSVNVGDVAVHVSDISLSRVVDDDPLLLADALCPIIRARERSNGRRFAQRNDATAAAEAIKSVYLRLTD